MANLIRFLLKFDTKHRMMDAVAGIPRWKIHLCAASHKQRRVIGIKMVDWRKLNKELSVLIVLLDYLLNAFFTDCLRNHGMT